jgi:hypothetical protein
MSETELAYASISELAPRLASGELSPIELTNAMLARIARYNPVLNAYITVTEESAREAAHAAAAAIRAGNYLGPLHGIPIAIKDLFATRAVRTTFGSRVFADWVPDHDAAAVERLRDAGAILIGKTNMHELAYGTTSANAHYGPVRNPLEHGVSSRWIQRGISGGGGRRAGVRCAWQRHWGISSSTSGLLWHRRTETHIRAGQQVRRAAARLVNGSCGSDGADGAGLRAVATDAGRLRST